MIASILLTSMLAVTQVAEVAYVEPEEHSHRIQFQFTRIPGTCNWTFRIGINGGKFEPEKPFPAQITCKPLNIEIEELTDN